MADERECQGVHVGTGSVAAKMACLKLERIHGQKGGTIRLSPVTGNSLENKQFWQYTPSGTFEFNSINEDAFQYFALGEEYRVTITRVPEVERVKGELEFLEAEIRSLKEKGETLGHWRVGSPEQVAYEIEQREKLAAPLRGRLEELTPPSGTFIER